MQTRAEDFVLENAALLLFLVERRNLILLENSPKFVLVTEFHFVNPFDNVGLWTLLRARCAK